MHSHIKAGDLESKKFDLILGSDKLLFDSRRIGWVYVEGKISIDNPTKSRYTWKVKSTDNRQFDIKTPMGFIDPSETIDVAVFHVPGVLIPRDDAHHFSVYYIKCDPEATDYHPLWRSKRPEGCKHIWIRFPRIKIMTKTMHVAEEEEQKRVREKENKFRDKAEDASAV